ncbi:CBM35 domain-containing protein [Streptomyces sp. SID13726]|uniref:CBM35 domain-containing protein n=1 Tax=Streptomyces sp. SID13726 TaxID=2706058 RepID=UPI0013BA13E8|nr:CBM35 domain-containing protein [Streptomyces sp. SID13726]NEB03805.1 carbohydrate-binding protein [Streptomyces sp. SID13726]
MTSGNNGASTPEDDDPFGYLYADGQANGAQPPSGGYGYPNSVNRVRAVGQRQYGQQQAPTAPTAPYGQVPQQQGTYGQPSAHYAAPETLPGAAPTSQQPMPGYSGRGGRGGGPNTKGLLIGAIAVVAAVVIGIGVAMMGGDGSKNDDANGASTTPSTSQSSEPSASASSSEAEAAELPKADVKTMRLEGGASGASDVKGAKSDGGVYIQGFNQQGASVTWTVNGIEKAGTYRVYVRYALPADDANATVTVNGKASSRPLNMKNFGGLPANEWQETWAQVSLTKGTNTIQLSCQQGNQCNALLDQFTVTENVDQ